MVSPTSVTRILQKLSGPKHREVDVVHVSSKDFCPLVFKLFRLLLLPVDGCENRKTAKEQQQTRIVLGRKDLSSHRPPQLTCYNSCGSPWGRHSNSPLINAFRASSESEDSPAVGTVPAFVPTF